MALEGLKTRLLKLTRRNSTFSPTDDEEVPPGKTKTASLRSRRSLAPSFLRRHTASSTRAEVDGVEEEILRVPEIHELSAAAKLEPQTARDRQPPSTTSTTAKHSEHQDNDNLNPHVANTTLYEHSSTTLALTPNTQISPVLEVEEPELEEIAIESNQDSSNQPRRPVELERKQSLVPHQQTRLIESLLHTEVPPTEYFMRGPESISPNMVSRKMWVKRSGASPTLVQIHEDDLVDDVREMILKKYANSLGRNFDAPDVTLRIIAREQRQERTLGPEEPMGRTLDAYFPGGQTVDEALIIDVPVRRTPKPSPQPQQRGYYDEQERRPTEGGSDYFPPMPVPTVPSPHLPNTLPVVNQSNGHHMEIPAHSMSVLTTGRVPALPSPGSTRRHHASRPRIGRQHTSSPTILSNAPPTSAVSNTPQTYARAGRPRTHSNASTKEPPPPSAPPLPTPPAAPSDALQIQRVATPPPRVSSPRPARKKSKKTSSEHPSLPTGMLNGAVPPINVLIVEDNIINLKLLEAFMKRLKVRWQTAMNGREAVTKWRAGGFHLVLMDIQLPIMSGLEATKEIRRLERLNGIGVFSSSASSSAPSVDGEEVEGEDRLPRDNLFKSPVIIVALTASSLQSDRHEALAAGCNDFLTKVRSPLLSTYEQRTNLSLAS